MENEREIAIKQIFKDAVEMMKKHKSGTATKNDMREFEAGIELVIGEGILTSNVIAEIETKALKEVGVTPEGMKAICDDAARLRR